MPRLLQAATISFCLVSTAAHLQAKPHPTTYPARTPPKAQTTSPLKPYATCRFDDGLTFVEVTPLPSSVVGRTVETMHGTAHVPLLRGEQIQLGYPGTDTFANVTVEQLPASSYDASKADLISNFEQILSSSDSVRNYALRPTLNGFEIYGLDRPKLEPGALGVYLLFDDRTGIVTTVRFPNQEPDARRFTTMEEFAALRDHFLPAYTTCIHSHPAATTTPASKPGTPAKSHSR